MVRANETVQHIFSELYTVQEHIKPSYIRIKLLGAFDTNRNGF